MSSLKSNQDIQRAARWLGINENDLRRAMKDGRLWDLAVRKAWNGSPGAEAVAKVLDLDAKTLDSYVRSAREREKQNRPEEIERQASIAFERYLMENPPS